MSGKEEPKKLELIPENKPRDLEIDVPGRNEPGFLRRQDTLIKFMHKFDSMQADKTYDPDLVGSMVDFIVQFVSVPENVEEAKEVLWELTEAQFEYVMAALQGLGQDVVPPTSPSP